MKTRIDNRSAVVSILGLGYVGLPLAVRFARAGYTVFGVDINPERVKAVKNGKSNISEELDNDLALALQENNLTITIDGENASKNSDFIVIVVPTPIDEAMNPVLKPLLDAVKTIQKALSPDKFVVIESTTYPGTTEDVVIPLLEQSGYVAGTDFGIAFSPERIDPGNKIYSLKNIPKIIGGLTPECTDIAIALYKSILESEIIPATNPKTAESIKLLENTFREVNIALVNELSSVFQKLGINTFEVIEKAATKPFAFMAHYPGPGVGGHCIPVDPFYLSYKARTVGLRTRFIELAGEVNQAMPLMVINLLELGLNENLRSIKDSNICVLGLSYKKNVGDTRNSPSQLVIEEILSRSGKLKTFDPLAKKLQINKNLTIESEHSLEDALKDSHAVILITNHDDFNKITREFLLTHTKKPLVFVDTCNFYPNGSTDKDFIYIGLGKPFDRYNFV